MKLKLFVVLFTFLFTLVISPELTFAHPGRTDSSGGHTCRTNCENWGLDYGEYHNHNGGSKPNLAPQQVAPPVVATPKPMVVTPKPVVKPVTPKPMVVTPKPVVKPAILPKPTVKATVTPTPTSEPTPQPKTSVILNLLVSSNQGLTLADLILKELKAKPGKTIVENVLGIPTPKRGFYPVTYVTDGDTIRVKVDGKEEKVRLLGIDTPETVDPRKEVQCFGLEASKKLSSLLSGKNVRLEIDSTQGDKDKYQRLLRWVYLEDGTDVNVLMVKEGYAFSYKKYPTQKLEQLNQLEKAAREGNLGLWNSCNEYE